MPLNIFECEFCWNSASQIDEWQVIGQVVKIFYPYDVEISVWKSITSTEYVGKLTLNNIHRDALRFKFADNPILQNKIVLNDEIFATITKNFYNGNWCK